MSVSTRGTRWTVGGGADGGRTTEVTLPGQLWHAVRGCQKNGRKTTGSVPDGERKACAGLDFGPDSNPQAIRSRNRPNR
jgi:hypothetical protein